jgi:hypothetical protein
MYAFLIIQNTNLPQLNGTWVYKNLPPLDIFFRMCPMAITPADPPWLPYTFTLALGTRWLPEGFFKAVTHRDHPYRDRKKKEYKK